MAQTASANLGWQNRFSTTLSSGITASDTTIPLNALPTPTEGFLVIEPDSSTAWEVIFYTSKTGSAVVCTSAANGRGVDDSTAQSHSSGAVVRMDTTAGMFEVLQNGSAMNAGALGGSPFATGWINAVLPSVSSVTNNGNRSYDITFASTVASYLTPGMRLRTSRTVAAPTQCADLEAGSSQYFNDTSLTGMTFTDDFTVMAWIKLESYDATLSPIVYRYNGTNGYGLRINSSGQVDLFGATTSFDSITSYQSVPLGKWTHVAATLDMSGATGTVYIDGVLVPSTYLNGGATTVTQAGDLNIGKSNASNYFDGKIAQVGIFSAVLSASTIRSYMSQTLSGSETNCVSAYSFNNSINDLNANANNLTAQGGALATNADSPFTTDSNGVIGGTYDYAIVTKVATTVATVQVPEGCAIPTSGGVSAVDLSTSDSPFGFPNTKLSSTVLVASSYATASTSAVQIPGLTTTVTVPTNATNLKITALLPNVTANGITDTYMSIWDGTVGSGTQLTETHQVIPASGYGSLHTATAVTKPTTNSKTYGVGLRVNANTATFAPGGTTSAGLLLVEYL